MAFDDGIRTVSGSVAHTDDAATKVPFVSIKCWIEPTLSGVSSVSETQTGRNIMANNIADGTDWGITHTKNADGSITIDGEATARISLFYMNPANLPSNTTYTLSTSYDGDVSGYIIQVTVRRKSDGEVSARRQVNKTTQSLSFNVAESEYISDAFLRVENGGTADNCKVYAQLENGSTAHAYEQYQTPTQYTANLGRTIYGGQVDIVNGTGKDMGAIHTITSENVNELSRLDGRRFYIHNRYVHCIIPSTDDADSIVCDKLKSQKGASVYDNRCFINSSGAIRINTTSEYATSSDFLEDFGGSITFAYILDASYYTDFTFTPITPTPETVGKVNNVYCNTGNTEVTYYDNAHGFAEVTVNKNGVSQTAYLHKVIYGGQADVVKGTCEPKNLFNEDWEVGGINDTTGLPNSETNKIRSKTFSSIKGGATCYVGSSKNIRVLFYASDESFILETANIMNSTFTTPVNCSLFKIRGTVDYGTTYSDDIIICYGSSASEYVPHFDPFTFPPISMETDEGENTLFANEGDSAITYRKAVD